MKKLLMGLITTALLMGGCAGLVLKKDDTLGEKTGKVTGRVVLGFYTLGISEIFMLRHSEEYDFDQNVKSWIGKNPDELIRAWGVPTSTAALSDGGKVIQYLNSGTSFVPGYYNQATGYYQSPIIGSWQCKVVFEADKKDAIVDGKWWGKC